MAGGRRTGIAAGALMAAALVVGACGGDAAEPIAWERIDPDPAGAGVPTAVIPWADGYVGVGGAQAWQTTDGRSWAAVELPGADDGGAGALAATGDTILAVGSVDQRAVAWVSGDGATWERVDDPDFQPVAGYLYTGLEGVAAGPAGLVAVGTEWGDAGQRAVAWVSPDGRSWTRASTDLAGSGPRDVIATSDGYVLAAADNAAAGEAVHAMFWTSGDGLIWTRSVDVPSAGNSEPQALAIRDDTIVAVGYRIVPSLGIAPMAWVSSDGVTWETAQDTEAFGWWPLPEPSPVRDAGAIQGSLMSGVVPAWAGFLATGGHFGVNPRLPATDEGPPFMIRSGLWWSADGRVWELVPNDLVTVDADRTGALSSGLAAVMDIDGRPVIAGAGADGDLGLWLGPASAITGN